MAARLILVMLGLALAACALAAPPAALAPVTRVASTSTATTSPVPATASRVPTATSTTPPTHTASPLAPSATPRPSATVPPVINFMAVGDLMLGRRVGAYIQVQGPGVVFSGVASIFDQADLLVGNLECAITDQGQPQPKSYTFRAPTQAVSALSSGGFGVVSLANNHAMDYGTDGLADMLTRLRDGGISAVGAGADADAARSPVILERHGIHVAFLAYVNVPVEGRTAFDTRSWSAGVAAPGVAWAEPAAIAKDVSAAKTLADVVVVLLHSGYEGRVEVNPIQRTLAHAAVDAGAGLVLGSHSHTLQPVEHYKDAIIAYGLGNFVFDGFTALSNDSAIFTAVLTLSGVESYTWVPVVVENGLPRLATREEAAKILPLVQEQ